MAVFSFLDISLETANKFYSWGWKASLFGAAVTLIGVSLLMWGTRVRDRDFEKQIAQLNSSAAQANAEAAKAYLKAETERLNRAKLEAELAPRKLEQMHSAKELNSFKGMSVIIESIYDLESWRTAKQVAWMLSNAEWNILPGMKRIMDDTMFFDGITIEINVGARPKEDNSVRAANALIAVFEKNKIKAHRMPSEDKLPLNTMKIRVGFKPTEYFDRDRKDSAYGNMLYK